MKSFSRSKVAIVLVSIALLAVGFLLAERGLIERQSFKAFYCAGAALNAGRDPYRVEPLRSCERQLSPALAQNAVEPAPLPASTLAPFALLARLPARIAAELFAVAAMAAAIAAAFCIADITGVAPLGVVLAFAPLALLNVAYGEFAPFALLALSVASAALRRERWILAGIATSAAALQPNVALPAIVAVFLLAPRTRLAIACSSAVIVAISIAAIGLAANVEYLREVLPLQAVSELSAADQYGWSHWFYVFGFPADASLHLANALFVLAEVAAIGATVLIVRRHRAYELLPILPPAVAVLCGIYIHDIQVIYTLPAAFVFATRCDRKYAQAIAIVALVLLVCVWDQHSRAVLLFDALASAAAVWCIVGASALRGVVLAAFVGIAVAVAAAAIQHAIPMHTEGIAQSIEASGSELSPIAWTRYLRASPALVRLEYTTKIPTWLGSTLAFLAFSSLAIRSPALKHEGSPCGEPSRSRC